MTYHKHLRIIVLGIPRLLVTSISGPSSIQAASPGEPVHRPIHAMFAELMDFPMSVVDTMSTV
jgi:hypothetical protein